MKITLIKPYGFCHGVQKTIDKTLEIIRNNPNKNIYLIGNLIHNKIVCDEIESFKNVKILSDSQLDRIALVKSIKTKNNICIFSAHGSDPKAIDLAKAKGNEVYDLTCPYVMAILKQINLAIKNGYYVAYYGIKNHPEAIAAKQTGLNKLVIYQTKSDLKNITKKEKVCVVCQTTMDEKKYLETKSWFKNISNLNFIDFVCESSRARQNNYSKLSKYDLIFVISDPTSHNGKSLFEVLNKYYDNVYFINPTYINIDKIMIKNKKHCAVLSSSSVSKQQVNTFVNKLRQLIKS